MTDALRELLAEARKAALAVHIAVEPGPAHSISNLITRLADELEWASRAPEVAPPQARLVTDARRFPVQSDKGQAKSVPWFMVASHEEQAQRNHNQTLERLAERGGLGPDELWCVVHDLPWKNRPTPEWCEAWLAGINDLRIAAVQAERVSGLGEPTP